MQIEACEGWNVEVRLFAPRDGSKVFTGVLLGLADDGSVVLQTGEGEEDVMTFEKSGIAKLSTVYDYD